MNTSSVNLVWALLVMSVVACDRGPKAQSKEGETSGPSVVSAPEEVRARLVLDAPGVVPDDLVSRIAGLAPVGPEEISRRARSAPGVLAELSRPDALRFVRELKALGFVARHEELDEPRVWRAPPWAAMPAREEGWRLVDGRFLKKASTELDLLPTLVIRAAKKLGGKAQEARYEFKVSGLTKKADGFVLYADAATEWGTFQYRVESEAGDPRVFSFLASKLTKPAALERVTLSHALQVESARAIGRNLRWDEVTTGHASFAHTPSMINFHGDATSFTWMPDENIDGARLGEGELAIDVVDHAFRPFRTYVSCAEGPGPARPSEDRSAPLLPKGSKVEARYDFVLGEVQAPVLGRFPQGKRAAVLFNEHADQGNAERVRILASADLPITVTTFLDAPGLAMRSALEDVKSSRLHVASHGMSRAPATPKAIDEALAQWPPLRTWVDHSPVNQCAAVMNEGWDSGSEYFLLEVLAKHGVSALWSAQDLEPRPLNMFAATPRGVVAWYHPELSWYQHEFAMFRSTWMTQAATDVSNVFSDDALDALVREHGLVIPHTYAQSGPGMPRSFLVRKSGGLAVHPEILEMAERLKAREHELWSGELGATIEHLLRAQQVRLGLMPAGFLRVRNMSMRELTGFTLWVDSDVEIEAMDGDPVESRVVEDEKRRAVWFRIPARGERLVRLRRNGAPLDYVRAQAIEVE